MAYTVDDKGNLVPVTGNVPNNVLLKKFTLAQPMGGAPEGEVVTMAVTVSDVSNTTVLETLLGGYSNAEMAADMVSPLVPVAKEKFMWRDFSHLNEFSPVEDRVGRTGHINQIEHLSEMQTGQVEEHALAAWIPWAVENDADANYPVRSAHAQMIQGKLALNREIRIWDRLTSTANWTAGHYTTLTTNYLWPAGSTKNPLYDLNTYIKASWQPVTDIFMSAEAAGYFVADTKVVALIERVQGQANGNATTAVNPGSSGIQTIRLPGYPPIHVLSAKKYASSAMGYILDDDVVGVNIPTQLAGGNTKATHLSFRYRGRSGTGYTVNEYVPWGRGLNGGTMLEAGFSDGDIMISGTAGFLIKGVVSG
jgi:hypothetical protein